MLSVDGGGSGTSGVNGEFYGIGAGVLFNVLQLLCSSFTQVCASTLASVKFVAAHSGRFGCSAGGGCERACAVL